MRPIVTQSMDNCGAEPRDIVLQDLKSLTITVAGNDRSPVLHELCEEACFAARCCARVEDSFARLRIQKLGGNHCAGILNVAMTQLEGKVPNSTKSGLPGSRRESG